MKPMFHALSGLLLLLPAAAAHAKPADESAGILEHLINNPSPGAMRVEGLREPPPVRSDSGVQGGKALIIAVPGLSKDVWSVPAKSPTTGTVEAGDELVFAVWARLVKSDGAKVADVPYAALQETSEPWTAVVKGGGFRWPGLEAVQLHRQDGKALRARRPYHIAASGHRKAQHRARAGLRSEHEPDGIGEIASGRCPPPKGHPASPAFIALGVFQSDVSRGNRK